jgi:hypothetical protein
MPILIYAAMWGAFFGMFAPDDRRPRADSSVL